MFFVLECNHIILIWDIQPLAINFYMAGNQDNSELERPPELKAGDREIPAGSYVSIGKRENNKTVLPLDPRTIILDMAQKSFEDLARKPENRNSLDPTLHAELAQRYAKQFFDSIEQNADFRKCAKSLVGMVCMNVNYNTGWFPNSGLDKGFNASIKFDFPLGGDGERKR
jgi:hypothetical protein